MRTIEPYFWKFLFIFENIFCSTKNVYGSIWIVRTLFSHKTVTCNDRDYNMKRKSNPSILFGMYFKVQIYIISLFSYFMIMRVFEKGKIFSGWNQPENTKRSGGEGGKGVAIFGWNKLKTATIKKHQHITIFFKTYKIKIYIS